MSNHDNTNRGAIWNNDKKTTSKHPDLRGELNVEGVLYWVSAWKKGTGDNPKAPVLKFSITRKDQTGSREKLVEPVSDNSTAGDDGFDSIPFAPIDSRV